MAILANTPIPKYLQKHYWWAYLHPNALRIFDRQWVVNCILFNQAKKLIHEVLTEIDATRDLTVLQTSCVYGDFTPKLLTKLSQNSTLDIIDVAPIQISNLQKKLTSNEKIRLSIQDATSLNYADNSFDIIIIFFLLHEIPSAARLETINEALRLIKADGKIIFVDYHKPTWYNPLRYLVLPFLQYFEPFLKSFLTIDSLQMNLNNKGAKFIKKTFCAGLYQKIVASISK